LLLLQDQRFLVASELDTTRKLDGTIIKKWTGGDANVARKLYGEETKFSVLGRVWVFANDMPGVGCCDSATTGRLEITEFKRPYTDNPDPRKMELQKVDKKTLTLEFATADFQKTFIMLLVTAYVRDALYREQGFQMEIPLALKASKKIWVPDTLSVIDRMKTCFVFTNGAEDFVLSSDIQRELPSGLTMSKFSSEIGIAAQTEQLENVKAGSKKVSGRTVRVWYGMMTQFDYDERTSCQLEDSTAAPSNQSHPLNSDDDPEDTVPPSKKSRY
jgi:hypothetical protein